MTRDTQEVILIGILVIAFAVICLGLFEIAYGATRYTGKEFSCTFPGDPITKTYKIGSPYGDVDIEEAEYSTDQYWVSMRHALIPDQMLAEQTSRDLATRMLAPIAKRSEQPIGKIELKRVPIPIKKKAEGFWADFNIGDCRYLAIVFVLPNHVWCVSFKECGDAHHAEVLGFMESVYVKRIDGEKNGQK